MKRKWKKLKTFLQQSMSGPLTENCLNHEDGVNWWHFEFYFVTLSIIVNFSDLSPGETSALTRSSFQNNGTPSLCPWLFVYKYLLLLVVYKQSEELCRQYSTTKGPGTTARPWEHPFFKRIGPQIKKRLDKSTHENGFMWVQRLNCEVTLLMPALRIIEWNIFNKLKVFVSLTDFKKSVY